MALGDYKRNSDSSLIAKRMLGEVVNLFDEIVASATSEVIDTLDYGSILIQAIVSVSAKNWTIKIQGSLTSDGTFSDIYDSGTLVSKQTSTDYFAIWKNLPRYIKIVATEDADGGKLTLNYQLIRI